VHVRVSALNKGHLSRFCSVR